MTSKITKFIRSLHHNLHSAATENLLTSILTASLNTDTKLLTWLIQEKAGLNPSGLKFRSTANDRIPPCMQHRVKAGHRYIKPDVIIWARGRQKIWETLYKLCYNKNEKHEQTLAKKEVWAIFVEVKLNYLSQDDANKYITFIKKLSEDCPNCRFLLITTNSKNAIHNKTTEDLAAWSKLESVLQQHKWPILTFEEIQDMIRTIKKPSDEARVLEEYLDLMLHPECEALWQYAIKESIPGQNDDLIYDLVTIIHDFARDAGIDVASFKYQPRAKIQCITFINGKTTIQDSRPGYELSIRVDKHNWVNFGKPLTAKNISRNLEIIKGQLCPQ